MSSILVHALREAGDRIGVERIERAWIFPPRRGGGRESGVAVFAARPEAPADSDRRSILLLRYRVVSDRGKLSRDESLTEEALAPIELVDRVVEGVQRRLDDPATEADPSVHDIDGQGSEWSALLTGLEADELLDTPYQE